jgi:hypothetical protein
VGVRGKKKEYTGGIISFIIIKFPAIVPDVISAQTTK